jgi:potassium-dependent mechanosensitive channel
MPLVRLRDMRVATALLLAALAFGAAHPAAAQQAASKAAAPVEKPAPPSTAAAQEDSEVALTRARDLAAVGAASPALQDLVPFLQREENNFMTHLQRLLDADATLLAGMFELELRDARTRAALSLRAVRERRSALGDSLAQLKAAQDELDALREIWTKRLAAERERGSPPALLERIDQLLSTIKEARDVQRERRQSLLQLDNRLSDLQDRLSSVHDRISEVQRQAQRRLFRLSEPTLWEVLFSAEQGRGIGMALMRSDFSRGLQTVAEFWGDFSDRVILQLVILALLLGAMASLSLSPAIRAIEALSGSVRVLRRPVASAFVIVLFLSPVIYPAMPLAVSALLRLASLVPVWRLIPTFVPPAWRPLFYSVAGLFGLETLFTMLPEGTGLSRLFLLAHSAFALWVSTVVVRRPFSGGALAKWRWAGIVRQGLRLISLLLLAAIVANLIGATRLALALSGGIVAPAYLGIGLAAVIFAVDDFVGLLLHAQFMQGSRAVALHRQRMLRRVSAWIRWLAAAMWLWLTLRVLGIDFEIIDGVTRLLAASTKLGTFELSLGRVLLFLLAVWIAVATARFVSFVLDNDVLPRMRLARGLPGTISTTSRYLIIGLGLLIAASIAGVDLTQITLILGALSVGIGFGLQNIVNNFISGIILLFERPIQVGDTIQVGELFGVVREIGIRASNVRTYAGAEVIVPNAELVSGQVINWTLSDRYRRLELNVGVAYGNRPADVIRVLEDLVRNHDAALKTPAPYVRFHGFGDSSLDFRVYVWVDFDEGIAATSAILSAVYDALAEAGIEIPFPQRDLHLRSVSDAARDALQGKPR